MYKEHIAPKLDKIDSEFAHHTVVSLLHTAERIPKVIEGILPGRKRFHDHRLTVSLQNIPFDNSLIVGAGWTKNGKAVRGLHRLGFAGVEIGTVTQISQPGNEKPRQFYLGDGVAINCLGFNNEGAHAVSNNLRRYENRDFPIGINIGINKFTQAKDAPQAYADTFRVFHNQADYITINVSSPNTEGLRKLQGYEELKDIVQAVNQQTKELYTSVPILVKIAPDLNFDQIHDVNKLVIDNNLAGIIATNTTNDETIKGHYGPRSKNQPGGLSGNDPHFRELSNRTIAYIYSEIGDRITIMGVGGINSAETAIEKHLAGASLLQVVTALREQGPTIADTINRGRVQWLEKHGISHIKDIIGSQQYSLRK